MLMVMEVCSVSCQANTGFQVQILPTESYFFNYLLIYLFIFFCHQFTPYISLECQQVWSFIMNWLTLQQKKLGFPNEDSIGKLLLSWMASDHWWVSSLFCQPYGTLHYKQTGNVRINTAACSCAHCCHEKAISIT